MKLNVTIHMDGYIRVERRALRGMRIILSRSLWLIVYKKLLGLNFIIVSNSRTVLYSAEVDNRWARVAEITGLSKIFLRE